MTDPARIWAVDPFAAVLDVVTNLVPQLVGRDLVIPAGAGEARGRLEELRVEPPVSMTGVAGEMVGLIGRLGAGLERAPAIGSLAGRARKLLGGNLVVAASMRAVLTGFEVPGEPAGRRLRELVVTVEDPALRVGPSPTINAPLVRVQARLGEADLHRWLTGTPGAGVRLFAPDRVLLPWNRGGRLGERASLEVEPRLEGDHVTLRPVALRLGARRLAPPRSLADRFEVQLPRFGEQVTVRSLRVEADHVRIDLEVRGWSEPVTADQLSAINGQLAGHLTGGTIRLLRATGAAAGRVSGTGPGPASPPPPAAATPPSH